MRTCCTCSRSPRRPGEFEGFGQKEYAALEHVQWFQSVGGYNAMNASRPQTVAAGLADSPVGTLAYCELFENFGNGTSLVTADQVLAQATLYWLTNTYASAARYHYEEQRADAEPVVSKGRIGVAVFKDDFQTIRASPSGTTPASSTGRSSPAAATSRPWRCRRTSSPTCGCSSPEPVVCPADPAHLEMSRVGAFLDPR